MADKKYDGIIEAVHYATDGQVEWVRGYFRRGSAWSDRVILERQKLIQLIKTGRQMVLGNRVPLMGGTFTTTFPIEISSKAGKEYLVTSTAAAVEQDHLEGAPVI